MSERTAPDAHIRHLQVTVPKDAVAYNHHDLADAALLMVERSMEGTITSANDVAFYDRYTYRFAPPGGRRTRPTAFS